MVSISTFPAMSFKQPAFGMTQAAQWPPRTELGDELSVVTEGQNVFFQNRRGKNLKLGSIQAQILKALFDHRKITTRVATIAMIRRTVFAQINNEMMKSLAGSLERHAGQPIIEVGKNNEGTRAYRLLV